VQLNHEVQGDVNGRETDFGKNNFPEKSHFSLDSLGKSIYFGSTT
jgi:hypothetical protein